MLSENILDRWIHSELQLLIREVDETMGQYELSKATRAFLPFIDNLSNWYIRRSRKRFWKSEDDSDKENAYQTLYDVLVTLAKLMAPFTPFLAEEIYKNLTSEESVHLADWPNVDEKLIDEKLNEDMNLLREVVTIALQKRSEKNVKVRQPLNGVLLPQKYASVFDRTINDLGWSGILTEELNVKNVTLGDHTEVDFDWDITSELKLEGEAREIIRAIQEGRKKAKFNVEDRIILGYHGKEKVFKNVELKEMIQKEILAPQEPANGDLTDDEYRESVEIEGEMFSFSLKRV